MKFPRIPDSGIVVFDVETSGLDWRKDHPVGYVVTVGHKLSDSSYFPIRHASKNVDADEVVNWIRQWAKNPNLRIVGHNLKFDLHFAKNDGIDFAGPVECTMVTEALLDENAGKYSLEDSAKRRGVPLKRGDELYNHLASIFGGEPVKKQMSNYHKLDGDDPIGVGYAVQDGQSTWCLREAQLELVKAEDLELVHSVECRVLKALFHMERRGVKIDEEKLHKLNKWLERQIEDALKELPKDFNVRSTPQVRKLMEASGASGWPITDKGNASFPESFLVTHPVGQKVVKVRKFSTLLDSFVTPMIQEHLFNGRVHTTFNQTKQDEFGVVSGRLSSSNPNEQQVPKRDKTLGRLFRAIHVADTGRRWSANDYSQQEFRVFAEYSQAPSLVAGYNASPAVDIHQSVADLLGVERDPTAKRLNLGMLYGMGRAKLAASLGIPETVAATYINGYHERLPEVRQFLKSAEYWAKQRGWVRTKLYRRRRFPDIRLAHKAGNSIIQGTSADITKLKMVEIDEFFAKHGGGELLLQVHDELDWQFDAGAEELDTAAREIMCDFKDGCAIKLEHVPMAVDFKHGHDWAEATYGVQ